MSHSDFDVVTGPSMAQRRAPVPEQSNRSSGADAEPAAQPKAADESNVAR